MGRITTLVGLENERKERHEKEEEEEEEGIVQNSKTIVSNLDSEKEPQYQ
jgi:hypothetical protein